MALKGLFELLNSNSSNSCEMTLMSKCDKDDNGHTFMLKRLEHFQFPSLI